MQETQTTKDRVLDLIDEQILNARREHREARQADADFEMNRIEGGLTELRFLKKTIEREIPDEA